MESFGLTLINLCFTHLCLLIDVILRLGGELIVNFYFIHLYSFII
jgi:hypothetical protein